MGSDEAGAASAIRGMGSEPCRASRGFDNAYGRRVHTKWRDGVVVGAEPARSRCECPGVPGPHRTAREPIPSAATGRCETRAVRELDDFYRHRIVTETLLLVARHRRGSIASCHTIRRCPALHAYRT